MWQVIDKLGYIRWNVLAKKVELGIIPKVLYSPQKNAKSLFKNGKNVLDFNKGDNVWYRKLFSKFLKILSFFLLFNLFSN